MQKPDTPKRNWQLAITHDQAVIRGLAILSVSGSGLVNLTGPSLLENHSERRCGVSVRVFAEGTYDDYTKGRVSPPSKTATLRPIGEQCRHVVRLDGPMLRKG